MSYHFIPIRMPPSQKKEKSELLYPVDGNVKWINTMKNNMEVPQKIKNKINIQQILLLNIYLKELKTGS
jgi:hypothetical protein